MIYENRWDFIRPYVEDKRVLDIGPAELVGTVNREKLDRWMHRRIAEVARKVVGLEKNPEQVQVLVDMGYDIREGDAEQFDLNENFDVVIAGEVIEHLSNPGKFLASSKKHLAEAGKLLLTTPNRYSILSLYHVIRSGEVPAYQKPIAKHVAYFDSDALRSLLKRHSFGEVHIDYCKWVGVPSTNLLVKLLVELASLYRPVLLPVLLAIGCK
ncbi:MAG: class I SAM-dependent methyltransferase [Candidatus Hodarchaeota archaeon]